MTNYSLSFFLYAVQIQLVLAIALRTNGNSGEIIDVRLYKAASRMQTLTAVVGVCHPLIALLFVD